MGGAALGGGIAGGALGAGVGAIEAAEHNREAASLRRRVRAGIERGEDRAVSATFNALQDPAYQAQRQFLEGLFGIQGGGQFGGGLTIGGETFFTDPGLRGFSPRTTRTGRRIGRGLSRSLAAEEELERGFRVGPGGRTNALSARRTARLERLSDPTQRAQLLEAFEDDLGARTSALTALRTRGFDLADIDPALAGAPGPGAPGGVGGAIDPLTAYTERALQTALSQSGFGTGLAGAFAQGAGTGAYATQLRLGLLDRLQGLATAPESLFQQNLGQYVPLEVQRRTGGVAVYGQSIGAAGLPQSVAGSALSSGLQGAAAGAALGQQQGILGQPQQNPLLPTLNPLFQSGPSGRPFATINF